MGEKISQVVEETERDSEQHVDDSQDDRHLHLERVQEGQLVGGNVPYLRDSYCSLMFNHNIPCYIRKFMTAVRIQQRDVIADVY